MLSTDLLERQLLDALPVSAYGLDLDGRVVSVHQPAARFGHDTGIPTPRGDDVRDMRDRPVWELASDVFPQEQVERAMVLLRTGRVPIAHWEVVRGNAPDRHALVVHMTPLHDETHTVTGFVVSTTDVTASYRVYEGAIEAGAALGRTIELDRVYQEAAHHIRQALRPDAVVIAVIEPVDSSSTPRIVYDSGIDDDRRTTERRFAAAWHEALDRSEVQTQRAESAWEITAPLIGERGPLGVITVAADDAATLEQIADARRLLVVMARHLAAAIERARSVTRAEQRQRIQAIGEVATGVAQELRNPIFGISSAAQLLRFRAREDPVMEKNVGRILREVERLNWMVTTLVELGRPLSLKRSSTDPDTLWDDVLEGERGRLESRVVAVRRSRTQPHVAIPIDAAQLAQAFRSILSNAVEAAPEASDIGLSSTTLPNGGWRCQLTNGGAPIPADVLPRVFDLFVSTKPGSAGTGLAHARRIIEEHGGTIAIESRAETGTVVTVTLPAH